MMIRIALIALTLQGCAVFEPVRGTPVRHEVNARIVLVDHLPTHTNGFAVLEGDTCTVFLKRSQYPYCMTHELRHCFEHHWHDEKPNQTDCNTQ